MIVTGGYRVKECMLHYIEPNMAVVEELFEKEFHILLAPSSTLPLAAVLLYPA